MSTNKVVSKKRKREPETQPEVAIVVVVKNTRRYRATCGKSVRVGRTCKCKECTKKAEAAKAPNPN